MLDRLRDTTGESAQLYRRQGSSRLCIAAAERGSGLRDTVPVGSVLPLTAGSAAQVLLAWTPDDPLVASAAFGPRVLAEVRRRGWAHSVAEREQGVASVVRPGPGPGRDRGRRRERVRAAGAADPRAGTPARPGGRRRGRRADAGQWAVWAD